MERKKIKVKRGNLKKKKKTSASERSERAGGVWGALPPEILVCGGLSRISVRSFTVEIARMATSRSNCQRKVLLGSLAGRSHQELPRNISYTMATSRLPLKCCVQLPAPLCQIPHNSTAVRAANIPRLNLEPIVERQP